MTTALYDAFVSYAHEDESLATALQHGVERFAKPWWRSRALRLCRDRTTMAATADLLGTIEAALQASGKLVVILSPAAATSEWVDREVAWWLGHKPPSDLVLVLAEGELEWGDGVWDATSHPVLPPALRELTTEPLWVDLRDTAPGSSQWTERVAEVAAAVRNVPKDLLFGVHRHESRRRVRHLGAVGGVGVVLVVAGLIAALLASERGQLALAGRLAARSTALLGTDLVQAQLLAVRAYRMMAPTDETTAALFRAVTATPQAVGYLDAGEPVTAVARARTADVVVAGTESGNVLRWSGGVRTVIGHTDGATNAVSVSDDGAVASMAGGTQARLWVGGRLHAVDLGDDRKAGPTAVSPSGHTALFDAVSTLDLTDGPPPGAIVTVDVPTRAYRSFALPGWWRELHAPADGRVVAAGDTGGWWLGSGDGRVDVAGSVYTGAHAVTSAISTDGRYFSFTNGSPQVPVWDTAPGEADTQQPNRLAAAPPAGAGALAISPDGRRLAASGADGVYVSAIATVSTTAPLTLPGDSFVTALHFVDDNTLVGAAGHAVVTWDLTRVSRIAMDDVPADVPWPCNACPGVEVLVRPDGGAVGVFGSGPYGVVVRYDGARPSAARFATGGLLTIAHAAWSADNLFASITEDRRTVDAEIHGDDGRLVGTWPVARGAGTGELGLGHAADGSLYDVDSLGRVFLRDPATGRVLNTQPGPTVTAAETKGTQSSAVASDAARAAVVAGGVVRLLELDSGRSAILTTGATKIAFAGSSLLVRFADGRLEIRAAADGALLHDLGPRQPPTWADIPSTNGTMLADVFADGSVHLADATTGAEIGSVPLDTALVREKAGLAFTPDGATLVVAAPSGSRGSVQRWSVAPARWVETACALAGRDLTQEEWSAAGGTGHPDLRCAG